MAKAAAVRQAVSAGFGRHGGRLDDARRAFPNAPEPWLDLSTGINPEAWTPPPSLAVDPAPLPTTSALAMLEATAARFFGTAAERTIAVPGSEIALRLLGALGLPSPIVACRPCYPTHAAVADAQVDAAQLQGAVGHPGSLLLANPGNPDGRSWSRADLARLADRQRAAGGWLVVDEAFADAHEDGRAFATDSDDAPIVVLRSFGKFFGLAGVRLGFVIAPIPIVHRLRALLGDWPVSAQAIGWGTAAYADHAWIAGTRQRLTSDAAGLDRMLARHGLHARGESQLFRLVEHEAAPVIFDRLARAGILTRPFDLRPDWLRFGLPGGAAALDRLDRALADG